MAGRAAIAAGRKRFTNRDAVTFPLLDASKGLDEAASDCSPATVALQELHRISAKQKRPINVNAALGAPARLASVGPLKSTYGRVLCLSRAIS